MRPPSVVVVFRGLLRGLRGRRKGRGAARAAAPGATGAAAATPGATRAAAATAAIATLATSFRTFPRGSRAGIPIVLSEKKRRRWLKIHLHDSFSFSSLTCLCSLCISHLLQNILASPCSCPLRRTLKGEDHATNLKWKCSISHCTYYVHTYLNNLTSNAYRLATDSCTC